MPCLPQLLVRLHWLTPHRRENCHPLKRSHGHVRVLHDGEISHSSLVITADVASEDDITLLTPMSLETNAYLVFDFRCRCDRQQPCSTCASHGQTCTYAESHGVTMLSKELPSNATTLHDRIIHLERLVKSLMPGMQDRLISDPNRRNLVSESPALDTSMEDRSECGSMRLSDSEFHYIGGDHWAAIMDGIADLKDHFDREELQNSVSILEQSQDTDSEPTSKPQSPRALLLYGCRRPTCRAEILDALPPRSEVDRLMSRYFNRLDLVSSCKSSSSIQSKHPYSSTNVLYAPLAAIHGPSFLREVSEIPL
jgi:hypothetical protein